MNRSLCRWAAAFALLTSCGGSGESPDSGFLDASVAPRADGAFPDVPQLDVRPPTLDARLPITTVRLDPSHGAFRGGQTAIVRGSGFVERFWTSARVLESWPSRQSVWVPHGLLHSR